MSQVADGKPELTSRPCGSADGRMRCALDAVRPAKSSPPSRKPSNGFVRLPCAPSDRGVAKWCMTLRTFGKRLFPIMVFRAVVSKASAVRPKLLPARRLQTAASPRFAAERSRTSSPCTASASGKAANPSRMSNPTECIPSISAALATFPFRAERAQIGGHRRPISERFQRRKHLGMPASGDGERPQSGLANCKAPSPRKRLIRGGSPHELALPRRATPASAWERRPIEDCTPMAAFSIPAVHSGLG